MEVYQNGTNGTEPMMFDLEKENINGVFSNLTLLSLVLMSVAANSTPIPVKQKVKEEYDYIIIGAGSAGSVMANRLSEKSCVSVLLLEAGGEPPLLTEVPGLAGYLQGSEIDWLYTTQPQKHGGFGQKNRSIFWNNGKVLGGSSVLNIMAYIRGNKRNFDEWEALGATGWSYDDVFKYFLKLEDNVNIAVLDKGYHRRGGPQTAERINYEAEIKEPLLKATAAMGIEDVDVNGRRQTGIFNVQVTSRNQQRCSTAKAYLVPAGDRPNLDIVTYAYARKILINQTGGRNEAYGVEFDHHNITQTVRARKEVILSSGAITTPQLLMLSGIGPRKELEKFNIPLVADLPVGKNLQDHCAADLLYTVDESIENAYVKIEDPRNILDYTFNRSGPLTSPAQMSLIAFLEGLNTNRYSEDFPRQELYFSEFDALAANVSMNLKEEVYDRVYKPYEGKPMYICFSSLLQPHSRGEVTLSSTDPYDYPLMDPRYYEDERDLDDVVEGMKICNAVAKHPAMRKVKAKLIDTQRTGYPDCDHLEEDEDKYLRCMARSVINTFHHFSGTTRMGPANDPRSVVDPKLRVIGVKNLRVVSAAVMPIITSGNTNVPTIMIAEKASDIIKKNIQCGDSR